MVERTTTSPTPLLRASGIDAGYGRIRVLRGLDLTIHAGEIVCLLGPNGAGKTTTIRVLSGLIVPWAGSVTIDGTEIAGCGAPNVVAAGIATVPEGRRVFAQLTVRENLLLGGYSRRGAWGGDGELDVAYRMFPRLQERQRQPAGTLSGGEQQMLAIARALMSRPRVVLFDEPSMGLAPILIDAVFETVERLSREGITVLLVEQNAEAALEIAHRAYIMERGQIVLSGSAADLRENPRVRASYLGVV
jgi:branched-chain amino acid transport system ATP-binding protein